MNINPKQLKYLSISQSWRNSMGKEYQGKFIFVNPITDTGKQNLENLNDLITIVEFKRWSEGLEYKFTDRDKAEWGCELYQIDGNKLTLVDSFYDTTD